MVRGVEDFHESGEVPYDGAAVLDRGARIPPDGNQEETKNIIFANEQQRTEAELAILGRVIGDLARLNEALGVQKQIA